MVKKAFELISKRVEEVLVAKNFSKIESENEMIKVFADSNVAYSVSYDDKSQKMFLKASVMTENGPSDDWKELSTWLFEPEVNSMKDAENIANDFAETIAGSSKSSTKSVKKKKKDSDDNVDDMFLINRFVNIFPDLKDDVKTERSFYDNFRTINFTKEYIVPRFLETINSNSQKDKFKKICKLLSNLYSSGNLDARALITFVILNSVENKDDIEKVEGELGEELQKAWKFSRKLKGKKIKPEKVKKKSSFVASTLNEQK